MNIDYSKIKSTIKSKRVEWKLHSLKRMLERSISREDIYQVLLNGEMIESYPNDEPFPSFLILGFVDKRPIHVVVAYNKYDDFISIITTYEPDSEIFTSDYKTRR